MVVASEVKVQRVEKAEKGFTVITPPHYGVSLPSQQGQTFVLNNWLQRGHGRILLLLHDPGRLVGNLDNYDWAHTEMNK